MYRFLTELKQFSHLRCLHMPFRSSNDLTMIHILFTEHPIGIRIRAVPLRRHKFVTPAINGSSWITNAAPSPDPIGVFANFHAEIAPSVIPRAFKLSWGELMVTNGVLENANARSISAAEKDIFGRSKESYNPIYPSAMPWIYSDTLVDYYWSHLDLYFTRGGCRVFFKLTEFRAAAEFLLFKQA